MLSCNFSEMTTSTPFRNLLHAANLRHGTDGFTSPTKEGVLRTFSPLKIRRLRSGLNPRTWVLKASTLLLDHRSRFCDLIAPYETVDRNGELCSPTASCGMMVRNCEFFGPIEAHEMVDRICESRIWKIVSAQPGGRAI